MLQIVHFWWKPCC